MKKILGLDLGTNSIGWALIEIDHENGTVKIIGLGSRILPMDAGEIKEFEGGGKIKSTAAQRTEKRGTRRLNERYLLRRDRLHLVLNLLNALPEHYKLEIDLPDRNTEKCKGADGKFNENKEPKLAYFPKQKGKKAKFIFMDSYQEMLNDIGSDNVKNEKGKRIPYDWTLYYLRQKALSQKISLEEFAWVLLSYNQKRGYEKTEALDDYDDLAKKYEEFGISKSIYEVIDTSKSEIEPLPSKVIEITENSDKNGKYYNITLDNGYSYKEYSNEQITKMEVGIDEIKIIERFSYLNEDSSAIDETKTIYKIDDNFNLTVKNIKPTDVKRKKYLKEYTNGWKVDTNESDFRKFKKSKDEIKEDIFITRLYDMKGNLIKPTKKNDNLNLNLSKDTFSDFKLLDPNKASNWKVLKKKTEKEAISYNVLNGFEGKKYISPKIYDTLKNDAKAGKNIPNTKIIGGMFQVVERDFYREELNQIIKIQKKEHSNLKDVELINKCVETLYPNNEKHRKTLIDSKDTITQLLVEDVLLYHRPLKSKKSEIGNCKYEIRYWKDIVDKETGEIFEKNEPVYNKVVSASHPYFQEFRIWDKIHNLRLIELEKIDKKTGEIKTNIDVTKDFFKGEEEYQELFEEFNNRKSLNQEQFLAYCKKKFKIDYNKKDSNYVWNFPEDEELKGNETRVSFATRFKRCGFDYKDFLTKEKELKLWHYLYSVSYKERTAKDKQGNKNKSLRTFFNKFLEGSNVTNEVKEKIIDGFVNYPGFASRYCAYSEKALKKILPLIRLSENKDADSWDNEKWYKKWKETLEKRKKEILSKTKKIDFKADDIDYSKAVITEVDYKKGELPYPKGLFNTFKDFEKIEDFTKLNLTQASYLIYGRHSELAQAKFWTSPKQVREELHKELKQHSLNNLVAEKVLIEMMQVVADIWDYYGDGAEKFFSRIHIEVGRELKKTAKEKEAETKRMSGNRKQNDRLRQILEEFLVPKYNAKSGNKDHFERLKIVEESAEHRKNIEKDFFKDKAYSKKDIDDILKKTKISKTEFDKYKLWIEQGYRSPYSGRTIALSELFNENKYNIDHIFPQASVTNNSLSNKVVVEVELNQLKSDRTARAFIQEQKSQPYLGIPVCDDEKYKTLVRSQFSGNKKSNLLAVNIPKGFTNSQLNNARHIARKAMELLSHIVREKGEVEFRSKNVLPVTGRITSDLKKAWRLNEVWTELVSPRFIRMNELTKSKLFGDYQTNKEGHEYFDCNLDKTIRENDESYDIKRIDHRHHALDALIIALCTEEHVNYLNNINANVKQKDFGTQKQLDEYRKTLKKKIKFTVKDDETKEKNWRFMLPGEKRKDNEKNSQKETVLEKSYFYELKPFNSDYKKMVLTALQNTIVTFKQKKSYIRKATNKYLSFKDENGKIKNKKSLTRQIDVNSKDFNSENKRNIAIRKKMHDEIPYGKSTVDFDYKKITDEIGKRHLIIDENILLQVEDAYAINDENISKTKKYLKQHPIEDKFGKPILETAFKIEKKEDKIAYTIRKDLTEITNVKRLRKIPDLNLQNELLKHLAKYNTIKVPVKDASEFISKSIEYDEFKNICKEDERFKTISDFIGYLEENKFKYKNSNFASVNFFVKDINDEIDVHKYELQENFNLAFSPTGIEELNKERAIPVKKIKQFERSEGKYSLGKNIGNKHKMVKGANSLFIIDRNADNQFQTIKLNKEIEEYLKGNKIDNKDTMDKFFLKAGDLVYVPTDIEIEKPNKIDSQNLDLNRIYKFVKSTGTTADFIPYSISKVIYDYNEKSKSDKEMLKTLKEKYDNGMKMESGKLLKNEIGLGSRQDKNQKSINGEMIKERCWKLKVNRLGVIEKVIR